MKAIIVEHRGEQGTFKEIPRPQPGPHDILVRVTAAGVNPIDWKSRDRGDRPLPLILGQDFAGVVSEPGVRVTKYREGERVFGIARRHGAYAEYTMVAEDDDMDVIAKISDEVGDADAAALPTAGITALASIESLRVGNGTTLLILGATGGVGGFAAQIAKDRGAHVIGTGRSTNAAAANSLGIDEFIAYDDENVEQTVKAAHPNGVDAVLDLVDDEGAIKQMADLLHAGGRIVSTVGAADVDWFATRNITAQDMYSMESPQWSHTGLRILHELLEQQRLHVTIAAEYSLAHALDALEQSKKGGINGKLIITVT
jgi:NADPH:quinone reductase-like Zn-dependent oxidoreductase